MTKRKPSDEEDEIPVTRGSGNVFADLGRSNPEERLAKAQLASLIDDVIRERALTQQDAAALMGIDQPKGGTTHALAVSPAEYEDQFDRLVTAPATAGVLN